MYKPPAFIVHVDAPAYKAIVTVFEGYEIMVDDQGVHTDDASVEYSLRTLTTPDRVGAQPGFPAIITDAIVRIFKPVRLELWLPANKSEPAPDGTAF